MGPDRPFIVQYADFLVGAVRLDFGDSFALNQPVGKLLLERLPATVHLALAGLIISFAFGIPLGILSAVKRDSIFDKIGKTFAVFAMAALRFWVAIMLIILLGAQLGWLPTLGRGAIDGWFAEVSEIPDMIHHLLLPAFVLAITVIAAVMRLTRSAMLDVLDSDYIKFAQVKGLQDRVVI